MGSAFYPPPAGARRLPHHPGAPTFGHATAARQGATRGRGNAGTRRPKIQRSWLKTLVITDTLQPPALFTASPRRFSASSSGRFVVDFIPAYQTTSFTRRNYVGY